jgi:hypothetical protein
MISISLLLMLIGYFLSNKYISFVLYLFGGILFLFTLWFFRDPNRIIPEKVKQDESYIISPADGKVVEIIQQNSKMKSSRKLQIANLSASQILSEGEQRAISLADFLTEVQLKNPQRLILDLVSQLNIIVRELEEKELIKSADARQLSENTTRITSVLREQDTGSNVWSPSYFNNHIRFVMGVYFLFYIPFRLAVAVSWLTVLVYPIIMNILGGIVIIRYWLRDPFDPTRPWKGMDVKYWRMNAIDQIDETVNNVISYSNQSESRRKSITVGDTNENGFKLL